MLPILIALQVAAAPVPPGEKPVKEPYVQSDANAGAAPMTDDATFRAFHGLEGIKRITDDFVERNLKDPRIKEVFSDIDKVRLKRTLAEQFCYLLAGPCHYTGRDMAKSHKDMGLQATDFNALVENLQDAMDKEHVPFAAQNRLLAKLAPMERTVVERKDPQALKSLSKRMKTMISPPG
jgi:hemoglobin